MKNSQPSRKNKIIDVRGREPTKPRYYPKNKILKSLFLFLYKIIYNRRVVSSKNKVKRYLLHYYKKVILVSCWALMWVFFFRLDINIYNYMVGLSSYLIIEEFKPYFKQLFDRLGGNK